MREKTAMEKIKDAADRAKNQIENCFPVCDPDIETDPFEWAETVSVRVRSIMSNLDAILEALAALDAEKPGEDAEEVAISIANLFSTYTLRNDKHVPASVEAAQLLTRYAESYHAERCKECVEKFTCETCGNKEPNGCKGCYLSDGNISNNWKPHV